MAVPPENIPQPSETPVIEEEFLVGEWQEPIQKSRGLSPGLPAIISGTLLVALALFATGYFLKDKDFYFASVATLAIGFALIAQKKTTTEQHDVIISNLRLKVGNKVYALAEMAGFWLSDENGYTVINVEPKKSAIFPITIFYPEPAEERVREMLLHVLPEIESRKQDISDKINQYLKL
jgi:uncharacterized membrane protein YiaA